MFYPEINLERLIQARIESDIIKFIDENIEYYKAIVTTSDLVLTHLRRLRAETKIRSLTIIFNKKEYEVDNNGRIQEWPEGLGDTLDNELCKFIEIDCSKD